MEWCQTGRRATNEAINLVKGGAPPRRKWVGVAKMYRVPALWRREKPHPEHSIWVFVIAGTVSKKIHDY